MRVRYACDHHVRIGLPLSETFNVTLVRPDAFRPAEALRPTAFHLACALRRLGERVHLGENEFLHDATNIIVGAHLLDAPVAGTLPAGTIVFNTEALDQGAHADALRPFVARFHVWDYDRRNIERLRALGNRTVDVIAPGYVPEMTTVVHREVKDIDVLFYGQLSAHRRDILAAIEHRGFRVVWLHDVYGTARDPWLARARLVLNLHYRPGAPLELGRVVHLLANRCAVVAESDAPADIDPALARGLAAAPAASIPPLVGELLRDARRRTALAECGFAQITRMDYCVSVRHALGRRPVA